MNNIKKIACVLILCNSIGPTLVEARSGQIIPPPQPQAPWVPRSAAAPVTSYQAYQAQSAPQAGVYTLPFDSIWERMSSLWSAIPIGVKVFGGVIALCSISGLYGRLKRWLYSSDDKKEGDAYQAPTATRTVPLIGADDESGAARLVVSLPIRRGSVSSDNGAGAAAPLIRTDSVVNEADLPGRRSSNSSTDSASSDTPSLAVRDRSNSSSSSTQSDTSCNSCDTEKKRALVDPGIPSSSWETPGAETPGGPDLILSTRKGGICFDQIKRFFSKQGITNLEDVMEANWRNELVSSVRNRIGAIDQSRLDVSCFDQIVRSVITQDCPWYSAFLAKRNDYHLDQFRKSKREESIESTITLLSKAHATFSSFVEGCDDLPPIVRIAVPEQKSAECGAWALVNLFTMDQYIKEQENTLPFSFHSESLFRAHFTDRSRNQMVSNEYLAQKAREMQFGSPVVVAVDESVGQFPTNCTLLDDGFAFFDLYGVIKNNIRDKKVTNILLYSKINCNNCDHSEHWSAVSVAYTNDMKEPVIVFMDSLKGDAELQTRSIVKRIMCHISEQVKRAMEELGSAPKSY